MVSTIPIMTLTTFNWSKTAIIIIIVMVLIMSGIIFINYFLFFPGAFGLGTPVQPILIRFNNRLVSTFIIDNYCWYI